jgi:DNA-binding NarL/FixJ family response regulator
MTTRVLIVDPDLQFTSRLKPAVEAAGDFAVRVAATGSMALDIVQQDPQDVAVLDFEVSGMPDLVGWLREAQPTIYVLVTPRTSYQASQIAILNVQGTVTKPYFARQIVPVIIEAAAAKLRFEQQKQEQQKQEQRKRESRLAPVIPPETSIRPDDTFRRMTEAGHTDTTKKRASSTLTPSTPEAVIVEPPIPDEATIGDLVSGQTGQTTGNRAAQSVEPAKESLHVPPTARPTTLTTVPTALTAPTPPHAPPPTLPESSSPTHSPTAAPPSAAPDAPTPEAADTDSPSVAMKALEVSVDDTPLEKVSVQAVVEQVNIEAVESGHTQPGVLTQEVPTWVKPEITVPDLAVQLTQLTVDSSARATILSRGDEVIAAAGQLPAEAVPDAFAVIQALWMRQRGAGEAGEAGEASIGSDEANKPLITYMAVPGVGDFLLFSTPTVDGMTLSMLFAPDTSIRAIRRQAKEMVAALTVIPEPPPPALPEARPESPDALPATAAPAPPAASQTESPVVAQVSSAAIPTTTPEGVAPPAAATAAEEASATAPSVVPTPPSSALDVPAEPMVRYGAVWLRRGDEPATSEIEAALRVAADDHGWRVEQVEWRSVCLNVLLSVPTRTLPMVAVEALQREAAERLGYDPDALWEESFYVLPDGRLASEHEIADFLEFHHEAHPRR